MELAGRTLAITGVGGFIGFAMAERALALGMRVRGMDLAHDGVTRARRAGVEVFRGDVTDPLAAAQLVEEADVVFHTAAVLTESDDWPLFTRVNVGGTRTMVEAAEAAGVARFVHLSSVMVHGFDFPPGCDEDGPLRGEGNPYCQTKIDSESVALRAHDPDGMEVIVIRPGDVYGPGSVPWVLRPLEMIQKGLFVLPDGGRGVMNHVYIDNLVDAVVLALESDATGRPFIVTDGAETSFAEYFRRLAALAGKGPVRTAPAMLLRLAFGAVAGGAEALGVEPPATAAAVDFVNRPHAYSIARARRVLGYEPAVDLDEGMRRTGAWLREEGLIA